MCAFLFLGMLGEKVNLVEEFKEKRGLFNSHEVTESQNRQHSHFFSPESGIRASAIKAHILWDPHPGVLV